MRILGISAYFHDAAAALLIDGQVIAAAQEERFSRIKNDAAFPLEAVRFCLDLAGLTLNELDAVVFYDKPLLKLERLLESYHAQAPRGLRSFLLSMPAWMKQKIMLKKVIREQLRRLHAYDARKLKLLFCEHHLSHAASAFFVSPFEKAALLTIDGVGEWTTTSIGMGDGNTIRFEKEIRFPHSLGLLYSAFTYYCGFEVNAGEYKLMGLAPYGDEGSEQYADTAQKIRKRLCMVHADGSFVLDQDYFNYISGLRMVNEQKWEQLFGFERRKPGSALEMHHCNMALAIQRLTEEIVLKLARTARELTGMENICLAGGVALNCVANGKLLEAGIFKEMFIQPAAGDAGGALGAALAAYHIYFGKERSVRPGQDGMSGAYLGPRYGPDAVRKLAGKRRAVLTEYADDGELAGVVAKAIHAGKIVGWFQDRMEFGPRALGNRSILADPRDAGMQRKLNLHIKNREGFRPFAPVCTIERAGHYFDLGVASPYMLLTRPLRSEFRLPLPDGYARLDMKEKLAVVRSRFPAISHIDLSSRVQTVSEQSNPLLWRLLNAMEALTGEGMLINTSFNVRDEPIVCSPEQAYECFLRTEMDMLVINNFVFYRGDQPGAGGATAG